MASGLGVRGSVGIEHDLLDDLEPVALEARDATRPVREQAQPAQAHRAQDLGADPLLA